MLNDFYLSFSLRPISATADSGKTSCFTDPVLLKLLVQHSFSVQFQFWATVVMIRQAGICDQERHIP